LTSEENPPKWHFELFGVVASILLLQYTAAATTTTTTTFGFV